MTILRMIQYSMARERFREIDMLRGIGIFFIIIIHSASYFLHDKTARFLWNYAQFAVPVFVFCSTYLFFQKRSQYVRTSYLSYVAKRLSRLLTPYYVFLLFYLPLTEAVSTSEVDVWRVLREVTLSTPGTEINWAVLLFVYVAALMPLLLFLYRKIKPLFFVYVLLSVGVSMYLLVSPSPWNFRLVMWMPWSVIILYSWFYVRLEDRKWFYPFAIVTPLAAFVLSALFLQSRGTRLDFFPNKYPPNLYFLSYGILSTSLLYLAAKHGAFNAFFVRKPIDFLSKNSYSIFFIHLWLIIAATKFFNVRVLLWWQFAVVIFVMSVLVQTLTGNLLKRRRPLLEGDP